MVSCETARLIGPEESPCGPSSLERIDELLEVRILFRPNFEAQVCPLSLNFQG